MLLKSIFPLQLINSIRKLRGKIAHSPHQFHKCAAHKIKGNKYLCWIFPKPQFTHKQQSIDDDVIAQLLVMSLTPLFFNGGTFFHCRLEHTLFHESTVLSFQSYCYQLFLYYSSFYTHPQIYNFIFNPRLFHRLPSKTPPTT